MYIWYVHMYTNSVCVYVLKYVKYMSGIHYKGRNPLSLPDLHVPTNNRYEMLHTPPEPHPQKPHIPFNVWRWMYVYLYYCTTV